MPEVRDDTIVTRDGIQTLTRKVLMTPVIEDFTLAQHDHTNPVSGGPIALAYGSCYGNEINWAQADMAQDTTYLISDSAINTGQLHMFDHDGDGKLTATYGGIYLVNWAVSAELDTPNKHVNFGVAVDGVKVEMGKQHHENSTSNEQFTTSGTCLLSLSAGATIELYCLTTDTGAPDLLLDHLNLLVVGIAIIY